MNADHLIPTPDCARIAPLLPLLDDLTGTAADAARQHIVTCTYCQAKRHQYAALDRALQHHYDPAAFSRSRTEDIMTFITSNDTPTETQKPVPIQQIPSRRPRLGGFVAAVAALLVVVLAFGLLHNRLGQPALGTPIPSFPNTNGLIGGVSMVSPTEGWAIGHVTRTAEGAHPAGEVAFYHYLNGIWTPTYLPTHENFIQDGYDGFNGTISMDSATDGWAVVHNYNHTTTLFHYTGGTWGIMPADQIYTPQAFAPNSVWAIANTIQNSQESDVTHFDGTSWTLQHLDVLTNRAQMAIVQLSMLSDKEGWALIGSSGGKNGPAKALVMHYLNGTWTVHSALDDSLTADFIGISMTSATEGWAIGEKSVPDARGNTYHVPLAPLFYHYTNGQWHATTQPITQNDDIQMNAITQQSPTDGWIIGLDHGVLYNQTVSDFSRHLALLRLQAGQWHRVEIPSTGATNDEITAISFTANGTGWAVGYSSNIPFSDTIDREQVTAHAIPLLLLYQDGQWTIYQQAAKV